MIFPDSNVAAGRRAVPWVPPLTAIVFAAAVIQAANGILSTLVPLDLGLAGTPTPLIGLVVTGYSLGFLLGCVLAPQVIGPIGHIRAFAALAALYSLAALLFTAGQSAWSWAALRFVGGFCAAGLFTVIESWVAERAPSRGRGRILGVYMIVNKFGLIFGQGLLTLADRPGDAFFMLACGFATLAIIPVSLTRTSMPGGRVAATLGIRRLYRIAPIGVVGCFGAGLSNASVIGLAPVFGLQSGVAASMVPLLIVAAQLGTMTMQWPLGWISDRTDRRYVIVFTTLGSAGAALTTALIGGGSVWMLLALFGLWGGFGLSIYALCVAHASDFAQPDELVPLVSSLMLAWAVGSIIGPNLAAACMEAMGPDGLLYYAAAIPIVVCAFALWRITRRPPVPPEDRVPFVNVPATSPVAAELVRDESEAPEAAGSDTPPAAP